MSSESPKFFRYAPETSANFFRELLEAARHTASIRLTYSNFQYILSRFLDERTAPSQLTFAGHFAKMDYLLKESKAPWTIAQSANAARSRIRRSHSLPETELRESCLEDLKSVCQFIAFVDNTAIPKELISLFPKEAKRQSERKKVLGDCMRMIVTKWDERFVYGNIENYPEEDGSRVEYAGKNKYFPFDWTYLRKLFYSGEQINLVRPHLNADGSLQPELIIVEPDYLINVTTIARCFTHYADSPLVSLMNKIEPKADSQAILLGNFAGQLLDEELFGRAGVPQSASPDTKYKQSVEEFFRHNALSMLTTPIKSGQFHTDARRQMQNIHKALGEILPSVLGNFNSSEGIVEPSFFSEMLGIQGRMDYLQMDFRYVLEQKSGKGAFPYDGFVNPREAVEHNVQLQLYTLLFRYNYRRQIEANKFEIQPFLLYSKYDNSLLRVGSMPQVIFNAIKIRNGIAWQELMLMRPDGYRILDTLTPQRLNEKNVNDNLWLNYQLPQLTATLDVIHRASELERAYFYRFMTFISNEHVLSKLGNKTKECSGFASTWHDSLDEKRLAGNIYDNLTLVYPATDTKGEIDHVDLKYSDDIDNDMSNFRKGDIVILYPYNKGSEPDATRSMIIRCSISDITSDNHVVLTLRHPQSDNRVFVHEAGRVWAIEHDFMESSYSGLYRGMFAFLTAPKERRDLLLFQRRPETDPTRELRGDYGAFNEMMLRVKQARDFFLIIGPPGTGKTSFGLLNTLREELLEPDSSILLMSYTNRAVDEICSKLKQSGIDFIRIGGELTASPEYRENLITERIANIGRLSDVRAMLIRNRVYVGTTTAVTSHLNIFQLKHFDLAIIDEASQILEPHLMGILSATDSVGRPAISKFVMIGDHKQLPAVVQQTPEVSAVNDPLLNGICLDDCRYSLFERLLKKYSSDDSVVYMLTRQGRMHPDIATFPNEEFYGGRLTVVPRPHQQVVLPQHGTGKDGITDLLLTRRIAFISTEQPVNPTSDKVNTTEAEMIAATVVHIYNIEKAAFAVDDTVGVIVPYRNQISAVRKAIDRYGISILHGITIDTVERFQGSQRRYIVYGFTIQKYYQLNFLTSNVFRDIDGTVVDRKLNVAMTRAEEHLIMFGYAPLLRQNYTFRKLIDFVGKRNGYFELLCNDYISGNFKVPNL